MTGARGLGGAWGASYTTVAIRRCTFTRQIPEVFVFALIIFTRVARVAIVGKVYVFLVGVVPLLNASGVDWKISRIHQLAIRFGWNDDVSITIFVPCRITGHVQGSGCQVDGGGFDVSLPVRSIELPPLRRPPLTN